MRIIYALIVFYIWTQFFAYFFPDVSDTIYIISTAIIAAGTLAGGD